MASNESGWWYFRNGEIDWNYTGMAWGTRMEVAGGTTGMEESTGTIQGKGTASMGHGIIGMDGYRMT